MRQRVDSGGLPPDWRRDDAHERTAGRRGRVVVLLDP